MLSVREYAKKHKLSIYQVIKRVQRGELKSSFLEVDGRKVQFIEESYTPEPTESIREEISNSTKEGEEMVLVPLKEIREIKESLATIRERLEYLTELVGR